MSQGEKTALPQTPDPMIGIASVLQAHADEMTELQMAVIRGRHCKKKPQTTGATWWRCRASRSKRRG